MKRAVLALALMFVFVLMFAVVASAQYGDEAGKNQFSVKLGFFRPQDGDVRNATGDTWFAAGVDYTFMEMPTTRASVSLEWAQHSVDGGGDARIIPLTVNYSWKQEAAEGGMNQFYYGAGAGLYFVRAKGGGSTTSETKFGVQIHGGVDFGQMWFAELKYAFVGKIEGVNPGGLFLYVGKRF
ncbi:MAG: hypothetical protein IT210_15170 [Armatimonadetes bacterium]|nr:hypothetical protein [Armatimonadota bacterium]